MATFKVEWREAGEIEFEETVTNAKTVLEALQKSALDFEQVCDVKITEVF